MSPDDSYRGGQTTFERYGPEHYRRITKGRKRRARYSPREERCQADTPPVEDNPSPAGGIERMPNGPERQQEKPPDLRLISAELITDDHPVLHTFITAEDAQAWCDKNGYAPLAPAGPHGTLYANLNDVIAAAHRWFKGDEQARHPVIVNIAGAGIACLLVTATQAAELVAADQAAQEHTAWLSRN